MSTREATHEELKKMYRQLVVENKAQESKIENSQKIFDEQQESLISLIKKVEEQASEIERLKTEIDERREEKWQLTQENKMNKPLKEENND